MRWLLLIVGCGVMLGCGAESEKSADPGPVDEPDQTSDMTSEQPPDDTGEATSDDPDPRQPTFTYYRDIKPLVDHMCVRCHGPDGIREQVPLTDYEAIKPLGSLLKQKVTSRAMPPWGAGGDCRDYAYDESLSETEIAMLSTWVDEEMPAGDVGVTPAAIEVRDFAELTRTDLTIEMPLDYVMQQSPDEYRCFLIDWPEDTQKYITGFGAKPGNVAVVHHIIAYLIPPELAGQFEDWDALDEGPGYECFGGPTPSAIEGADLSGIQNTQMAFLGGWAPGGVGSDFPPGTGMRVAPGSKVALQMHYNTLVEEPQPDRTSVVFKIDDEVEKSAFILPWTNFQWLSGNGMEIPAGEADVVHSFDANPLDFPFFGPAESLKLYSAALHMHVLGTGGNVSITRADGTTECLVDFPTYDFNWQRNYGFAEPVMLYKEDKVHIECRWDNTPGNQAWVDQEQLEPQDQSWGDGTTDEMCVAFFYATIE